MNFGMPTQLNAPYTARQLSKAKMNFDGLQLDLHFPRRSSMPRQLNLVSLPRSPPLNAHANAPLAPNPPQAHINVPALPSLVLNPVPPHFPLIPPAFRFAPPPSQALPLHANKSVANNVNSLLCSPPAQFISSENVFVPQLIHPPPQKKNRQPQFFVPITHAAPTPSDPNVWRFPAAVPSHALTLVGTSVNFNSVQLAPTGNPHVTTSLHSSFHVQATTGSQNHVLSDLVQPNPVSSSTSTAPTFVTSIILPAYGATVSNPLCWGGPRHPTPSAPSLDSADLIKQCADTITCKKNDPLSEWKLSEYNGDPLQWHEWFGQFKSAIESQSLTEDVLLTYLKTLVTGKAKTAGAEFAYCGLVYKDALETLGT